MTATKMFIACGMHDVDEAEDLRKRRSDEPPRASIDPWNKPGAFEPGDGAEVPVGGERVSVRQCEPMDDAATAPTDHAPVLLRQ